MQKEAAVKSNSIEARNIFSYLEFMQRTDYWESSIDLIKRMMTNQAYETKDCLYRCLQQHSERNEKNIEKKIHPTR